MWPAVNPVEHLSTSVFIFCLLCSALGNLCINKTPVLPSPLSCQSVFSKLMSPLKHIYVFVCCSDQFHLFSATSVLWLTAQLDLLFDWYLAKQRAMWNHGIFEMRVPYPRVLTPLLAHGCRQMQSGPSYSPLVKNISSIGGPEMHLQMSDWSWCRLGEEKTKQIDSWFQLWFY